MGTVTCFVSLSPHSSSPRPDGGRCFIVLQAGLRLTCGQPCKCDGNYHHTAEYDFSSLQLPAGSRAPPSKKSTSFPNLSLYMDMDMDMDMGMPSRGFKNFRRGCLKIRSSPQHPCIHYTLPAHPCTLGFLHPCPPLRAASQA